VISDTTVGNILKAHGIEPAPERKQTTTWKTFLQVLSAGLGSEEEPFERRAAVGG